MVQALTVAGLHGQAKVAASEILAAFARLPRTETEGRAARDLARLSQFAIDLTRWNDQPVLLYRRETPAAGSE